MNSLDEKKKILEILEAKDACIRALQDQIESNNEIVFEIEQKLLKTQGLLKSVESENEMVCGIDGWQMHNPVVLRFLSSIWVIEVME